MKASFIGCVSNRTSPRILITIAGGCSSTSTINGSIGRIIAGSHPKATRRSEGSEEERRIQFKPRVTEAHRRGEQFKSQISNPKSQIPNPKSQISNLKSQIFKFQITDFRFPIFSAP